MNFILLRYHRPSVQIYKSLLAETVPLSGCSVKKAKLSYIGIGLQEKNRSQCKLQPLSNCFTTSGCSKTSFRDKLKQELSVIIKVDFKQLKNAPVAASVYGFGGILPFVFPPLYFIMGSYSPFLGTVHLSYGATILAFIGGIKWGNALAKDEISHEQIGISVVPSLVAWVSLLVPEPIGFLVVTSGLVGALYVDLVSSKYPPWFCAMRCTLTGIATASLITTLIFNIFN